jgi:hypothetical protein
LLLSRFVEDNAYNLYDRPLLHGSLVTAGSKIIIVRKEYIFLISDETAEGISKALDNNRFSLGTRGIRYISKALDNNRFNLGTRGL